jgi:hypothetical protein
MVNLPLPKHTGRMHLERRQDQQSVEIAYAVLLAGLVLLVVNAVTALVLTQVHLGGAEDPLTTTAFGVSAVLAVVTIVRVLRRS